MFTRLLFNSSHEVPDENKAPGETGVKGEKHATRGDGKEGVTRENEEVRDGKKPAGETGGGERAIDEVDARRKRVYFTLVENERGCE